MRYKNGVILMVPYIHLNEDQTTDRMWGRFTFKGDVDRRRVKRELTKWVRREVGRSLHPIERALILRRATPI